MQKKFIEKALEILKSEGYLEELRECSQGYTNPYHLENDVLTHTLMVIKELKEYIHNDEYFFTALLHDIGKPLTKHVIQNSKEFRYYFTGHDYASALIALDILPKYINDADAIKRITLAILNHINIYKKGIKNIPFKTHEELKTLLILANADKNGRISLKDSTKDFDVDKELNNAIIKNEENLDKNLILLFGIPGVGKTTYIDKLKNNYEDLYILSRDKIIEDYAKENNIGYREAYAKIDHEYLDKEFTFHIREARTHKNILVDMMNLNIKSRRKIINSLNNNKKNKRYVKVVMILNSIQNIYKNNKNRIDVGKDLSNIINKLCKSVVVPSYDEEIDYIDYYFSEQLNL